MKTELVINIQKIMTSKLNNRGDQLVRDIISDIYQVFPTFYDEMPHNWVEKLWKYCLLVWIKVPELKEGDPDSEILAKHRTYSFYYLFKVFLQKIGKMSLPEDLCIDFQKQMNHGFEIVTKSWFRVSVGEVQKKTITFLEHYLLLIREKGNNILDQELLSLLVQFTKGGNEIMDKYRLETYRFLGTFV